MNCQGCGAAPTREGERGCVTGIDRRPDKKNFDRRHGTRLREYGIGSLIFAEDFRSPAVPVWTAGIVQRRDGNVLYCVRVESQEWIRHVNQLKPRAAQDFEARGEKQEARVPRISSTEDIGDPLLFMYPGCSAGDEPSLGYACLVSSPAR